MPNDDMDWQLFLEKGIEKVKFAIGLDNDLARLAALNGLLGFLEGGLMIYLDGKKRDDKE